MENWFANVDGIFVVEAVDIILDEGILENLIAVLASVDHVFIIDVVFLDVFIDDVVFLKTVVKNAVVVDAGVRLYPYVFRLKIKTAIIFFSA